MPSMRTAHPARKVVAASGASFLASLALPLVQWLLTRYLPADIPGPALASLLTLIWLLLAILIAAITYLAGYYTPPALRDQIVGILRECAPGEQ